MALDDKRGWPFLYPGSKLRKENPARRLAEQDGIKHSLVWLFSAPEPCCKLLAALQEKAALPPAVAAQLFVRGTEVLTRRSRFSDKGPDYAAVVVAAVPRAPHASHAP